MRQNTGRNSGFHDWSVLDEVAADGSSPLALPSGFLRDALVKKQRKSLRRWMMKFQLLILTEPSYLVGAVGPRGRNCIPS